MILVKEMPTSGQFVAVWTDENGIWSDSYMWENGNLMEYISDQDVWDVAHWVDFVKGAVFVLQSHKA